MTDKNEYLVEVHLKRRILWWDGEKLCTIRKFRGSLEILHLEVIDGQGYVVAPFTYPDKYGCDSKEGLIFPIKESAEWVEDMKERQALLPRKLKDSILDDFIEDWRDFCRSDDKKNWVPKKIRELFKKKTDN